MYVQYYNPVQKLASCLAVSGWHSFLKEINFYSKKVVCMYLFNSKIPLGIVNVLLGASEDGHMVVLYLRRVL